LFLPNHELLNKITKEISTCLIDFTEQKACLTQQFKKLYNLAKQTDASFVGAVAAQEKKQLKGLEKLEKRLLKAERKKHADFLNRVTTLQQELFPKNNLQERKMNFSELYLEYGQALIPYLLRELHPLEQQFLIVGQ